jgi:ribosomal protein S18 acetylase RimI-like enzyme
MPVRLAHPNDIPALQRLDPWPKEPIWQQKIAHGEVIVLEVGGNVVGLARYAVLWTTVPFLGLIEIEEGYRKQGHSRAMLTFLTEHLRAQGYIALLSSSQTNEPEPQAWHLHMGFTSNGLIENIADEGVGELVYRLMLE